jgi:phosphoserine phosphatase
VIGATAFSAVVFDCDSTLVSVEGVDLLAGEERARIEALTASAMRGEVPLEEVYGLRLEMLRPSRARVEDVARAYVEALVEDAVDVARALAEEGIQVWILSGGLLPAVQRVADVLGVPGDRVHAVDLRFDAAGEYAGFDPMQLPARAGGKLASVRSWGDRLAQPVLMVGDGATDLEVRPGVEAFAAYAGVVERPTVTGAADVIMRAPSLAPVFALAMGDRIPEDPARLSLYRKGLELGWSSPTSSR